MDNIYKGNTWKVKCYAALYRIIKLVKQLLILTGGQELHIGFFVGLYLYVRGMCLLKNYNFSQLIFSIHPMIHALRKMIGQIIPDRQRDVSNDLNPVF
jgi:hypothetical protein